jgi:ABC-2 type transport system ATP-binding protein
MPEAVIKLEGLTKFYGKSRGVIDLDLEVMPGEVFGYLGPNGSGKTTTIRMLLGLIKPTDGAATVMGIPLATDSVQIRRKIGYIPGDPVLYGNLTGAEYLEYTANLRGGVDWRYVTKLTERLECDLSRRIDTLSKGNRQKIAVIHGLMHKPELLILDEPTSGLDPLMQETFEEIIREIKDEGRTVFLSSHILSEVEALCDRVGVIREGKLIAVEDVATFKSTQVRTLQIDFGGPIKSEDFSNIEGIRNLVVLERSLRCDIIGSLDALFKKAAQHEILNVTTDEPTLEEVFLAFYNDGGETDDAA